MLPDLAVLRGCRLERQKHKCICKASRSFPKGGKGRDTEEGVNVMSKRKDELRFNCFTVKAQNKLNNSKHNQQIRS